jgi:hypothetical protein
MEAIKQIIKVQEGKTVENNNVVVIGTIKNKFDYSHTYFNEDFYSSELTIKRYSGREDVIPFLVSHRLIGSYDMTGTRVEITGSFRRHVSIGSNGKKDRLLYIFVNFISLTDREDYNYVELIGTVCRQPVYRKTGTDREVTDLTLAVERHDKKDFIPVIAWGRNAVYATGFEIGTKVCAYGRIQSRDFYTGTADKREVKKAYEVSVHDIEVCHENHETEEIGNTGSCSMETEEALQ